MPESDIINKSVNLVISQNLKERLIETLFRHLSIEPDSEFKREIGVLMKKLEGL